MNKMPSNVQSRRDTPWMQANVTQQQVARRAANTVEQPLASPMPAYFAPLRPEAPRSEPSAIAGVTASGLQEKQAVGGLTRTALYRRAPLPSSAQLDDYLRYRSAAERVPTLTQSFNAYAAHRYGGDYSGHTLYRLADKLNGLVPGHCLQELALDPGIVARLPDFCRFCTDPAQHPLPADPWEVRQRYARSLEAGRDSRPLWRAIWLSAGEVENIAIHGMLPRGYVDSGITEAKLMASLSDHLPLSHAYHVGNENKAEHDPEVWNREPLVSAFYDRKIAIGFGRKHGNPGDKEQKKVHKDMYLFEVKVPQIDILSTNNTYLSSCQYDNIEMLIPYGIARNELVWLPKKISSHHAWAYYGIAKLTSFRWPT